jgi:hypothetical protein
VTFKYFLLVNTAYVCWHGPRYAETETANLRYPNRKIEVVAVLGLGVVEFKKGNSGVTSEQMEGDKKGALVQSHPKRSKARQGKASRAMPQRTDRNKSIHKTTTHRFKTPDNKTPSSSVRHRQAAEPPAKHTMLAILGCANCIACSHL